MCQADAGSWLAINRRVAFVEIFLSKHVEVSGRQTDEIGRSTQKSQEATDEKAMPR